MEKRKSHWQFLSLIFVLLMTGCLLTGTPTGVQNQQNALETIVAATLTALTGEAPAPPPATDTPEVPTVTAPRALQVAYVKNGNVYLWTEGESRLGLTSTGDAVNVRISDDGQVIAYVRKNPTNDFAYELWAVNTGDLTNARTLVSYEEFEALKAASPYPDARGLAPDFFKFQPGTHQLAYSTVPMFEGPGYAPGGDLRLIDVDKMEKTTVFDFNEGGLFYFSPDGTQVALSNPDHISLANADGSNLRPNVLTYPLVGTYSEYQYHPRPHWSSDSSYLRVAIPPEDTLAQPVPPTILWHIPTDGTPATQLGSIPAIPFAWPDTAFSPSLEKVGYASSTGEPSENRRELHIANADGSGDIVFATGVGVEFWQWTPDGTRFVYAINDGAERGVYLGQLSGGSTLIASIPLDINQMRWIDPSRFLYFQINGNEWELRISDVDGQNHAFIDTIPDSVGSFDFTQ
jgi:hypothetical protein